MIGREAKMTTFWITKYALTRGIFSIESKGPHKDYPGLLTSGPTYGTYHGEGREWHRTRERAVKRAENMRTARIESLRKQIAKLEKLRFE